jgi:CBS domain-containing protein
MTQEAHGSSGDSRKVRDVAGMRDLRQLAVVNQDLTVMAAAQLMAEEQIGAVIALKDGKAVGIFTERDLLNKVVAAQRDPATVTVAEVMSTDVVTIDLDDPVDSALQCMLDGRFRHLPIVDESGEPYAMLSLRDLVNIVSDAPLPYTLS